jgi:hypothetical protein
MKTMLGIIIGIGIALILAWAYITLTVPRM